MKNIKRNKSSKISPYYAALARLGAVVTHIVLATIIIMGIVSLTTRSWDGAVIPRYVVSQILFTLGDTLMIGGGFIVGFVLLRGQNLDKNERIVRAGTLGLLAGAIDSIAFQGFMWPSFHTLAPYVSVTFGPLISLATTALLGTIFMRRATSVRVVPILFVVLFGLEQIASLIYIFVVSLWPPAGTTSDWSPLWVAIPSLLLTPPLLAIGFYVSVRRIGRFARAYWAVFLSALVYYFMFTLFRLPFGTGSSLLLISTVVPVSAALVLTAAIAVRLIGIRRSR